MFARVKTVVTAGVIAMGLATAPALAQQSGLVNVEIGDVLTGDILSSNRVAIGLVADVAANVCGVTAQVGVIARQIATTGGYGCTNEQNTRFLQVTR